MKIIQIAVDWHNVYWLADSGDLYKRSTFCTDGKYTWDLHIKNN